MKTIAVLKIGLTLLLLSMSSFAPFPQGISESAQGQIAESQKVTAKSDSLFKNQTEYRLTLVTGDIVVVTDVPEGQENIQIITADPANPGRSFRMFTTPNGTYIIPSDVNLNKLDIELFNIDYLISEGYNDMANLPLIVQMKNSTNPLGGSLQATLGDPEDRVAYSFSNQRAFSEQIPITKVGDSVRALLELPDIEKIWLDRKIHPSLSESVPLIGAPELWESEYDGTGIQIAVLDTGIDKTHPGLDDIDDDPNTLDPKVVREIDFTDDYSTMDLHGHGTHVAGTAAGTGAKSPGLIYGREYLPNGWIAGGVAMGWRSDDASWSYALPFDFPFYGTYYRSIYVSSNGLITFNGPDVACVNSVPALAYRLAIAVAWDDWMTNQRPGDDIYIWQPDPDHVIIRWRVVAYYNRGTEANFEAVLSSDGAIKLYYANNNGPVSATIGISNRTGLPLAEDLTILNCINTVVFEVLGLFCKGVAPGASLWNVKVLDRHGSGYWSWAISGIEYAAYGPDGVSNTGDEANIINMSLGAGDGEGTDPLSMAVDAAVDLGVVVVVAAGNSGPMMSTVGTPGIARKALTVGATTKTDEVVSWSSRGPTVDYRLKPDIVAPGVDITSSVPHSLYGVYYQSWSGTSMSTPHVAGATALILQKNPLWSPLMVKSALMGKAEVIGNAHLWEQGAGRINVPAAAGTTLLAINPSLSFGMLRLGGVSSATLTIMNLADTPTTSEVSTYTTVDGVETGYVSTNVTTLTTPPLGNSYVLVNVGPLDDEAPDGWYEGWVIVTYDQGTIRVPYLFCAMSTVTVSVFDVDDVTPISAGIALTSYPSMSLVDFVWIDIGSSWPSAIIPVKSGSYSLQAQSAGVSNGAWPPDWSRMFMIQETFVVPKLANVDVRMSLAEAFASEIPTVDTLGENLVTHCYTQYFSGDPYFEPYVGETVMRWSMGGGWFGFDANVPSLTFYSSEYNPSDKLSEAFGCYASDDQLSEAYLLNWKYWNVSSIPPMITHTHSDLAKYIFFYDMPETYPENGLNIVSAFWFTWEHLGGSQGWGWDVHPVLAGISAVYYMAPESATYWGVYMPTHEGWGDLPFGPLQEWVVGRHYPYPQIPPQKGETGSRILGDFQIGPYVPNLALEVVPREGDSYIRLSGEIWSNLTWPHWLWFSGAILSPYPPLRVPFYHLYIDNNLVAYGSLGRPDGTWYGGLWWDDVDESWIVPGEKGLLAIDMPSLATISEQSVYEIEFNLAEYAYIPPVFGSLLMPLSYSPGEEIAIQFDASPSVSQLELEYSFDNGVTWNAAPPTPQGYMIVGEVADALALRVAAVDIYGNLLTYFSRSAALCREVDLSVPGEVSARPGETIELFGILATLEGIGLKRLAVSLSSNKIRYTSPNEEGAFVFSWVLPIGIRSYTIASSTVGVYEATSKKLVIRAPAAIEIYPEFLNLKSKGRWMTAYIQLPQGYGAAEIDASTVLLNGAIQPVLDPRYGFVTESSEYLVDYNNDGILERMVKLGRTEVSEYVFSMGIMYGNVALTLTGQLYDGTPFEGTDTIVVRMPGDVNCDGIVNAQDLASVGKTFGAKVGEPLYSIQADLDSNGITDTLDLAEVGKNFGKTYR